MDPYKILGISRNSTVKEIRDKYIFLARQYHPDKNVDKNTTAKFQEIEAAYRSATDNTIKTKKPPPPPPPPPPRHKFKKGQSLDDFLNDLVNDGKKKLGKKKDRWS